MKKFFEEIKADIKFKGAGPGQKLTESVGEKAPKGKPNQLALQHPRQGPTDEAQMAAAAALARLEQRQPRARGPVSQDSIRNQVRKELQAEATVGASPEAPGTNMVPEAKEEGSTHLLVPGVYFTCPLTGAILRKDQRDTHIKEAILSVLGQHPPASRGGEVPEDQAAEQGVPESPEEFYVLSETALAQPQSLERHKEQLLCAEPVRATLARQRRVFRPSPLASQFDLPVDFFNLTAEEVKREQRLRAEAVERLSVLRTKAMREKEEQREMRKYSYTLLRVRLPDGCLLQGTFYARERVAALYTFVREALQSDWLPFELLASGGQKLSEDENLAFNECGLVPSALLTFSWDAAVLEDIRAAGAEPDSSLLKPELLSAIEKLS
ncbi:UBX domain protein 6 [Rhinolophus ferrumequinum]|uniref:UBX domain-containing protein 6 n=1 Tax=Rhinolophus ferrumequinum TaxID=59479 RepID=A0A7J7U3H0_RHIFE|nr:UBX domain protein 6 [Rhinolophus ferrumequinum]